ncbi:MAG: hypothetical protein RL698_175 [Pseudomonadota bacterium]
MKPTARAGGVDPARRATGRWLAALVLGATLSLPWTVQRHWDAKPDAATYLIAARSLARGEGYRVMGDPFALRPPGWSAVLAPVVASRGLDFAALNLLGGAFGILAVALLFLLLRPRLGAPLACAVAAVVWVAPRFQQLCNQVLSDVPGFAAALAALLAIRWSAERASPRRDLLTGLAIGASAWLRTANLLLVPALALSRLLAPVPLPARSTAARRLAPALLPCAVAIAVYLPWALRADAPVAHGQESLQSYATALLRSDPLDPGSPLVGPGEALGRVARNVANYAALLGAAPDGLSPTVPAALLALAAALAWLVVLLRRREAPEWFAGLTAALVAAYYVAQARLALVPAVFALAATAETLRRLARRLLSRGAADGVVALALLAAIFAMHRGGAGFSRAQSGARAADLERVAEHLRATGFAGERLGGDFGTVYALLLDRPVEGLQFACNRLGAEAAREQVERAGLDRLVLQVDGPCPALLGLGEEEVRRGSFVVRRLRRATGAPPAAG